MQTSGMRQDSLSPNALNPSSSEALSVKYQSTAALKPCPHNSRTHSKRQIRQIAESIKRFGFTNPILVDSNGMILAGHGRLEAAKLLDINRVPTIQLEDLTPDEIRAYVMADNRLAEKAGWDPDILAIEFQHLLTLDNFDVCITGFEIPEIDLILEGSSLHKPQPGEVIEFETGPAVSRNGDLWSLGKHRLICGNSLQESTFTTLMGPRRANVVVTDPPYNVKIDGNVCGKGSIHHREFAMASGEMTEEEFITFLTTSLRLLARFSTAGSVHFIFMDWRHMAALQEAGKHCYGELLNLCVWVKPSGGMGSLYRSRHELVFAFKNGKGSHRNNIQLGRYGRNRTNVWEYPGVNTLSGNGEEGKLLALHPTVKPLGLVADALLDCSARGEVVLDSFLGSGTTLLAAERTGRRCYGIEIDPLYVDVAIRRWQRYTGERAIHHSGMSFDELATKWSRSEPNNKENHGPETQ
jgi:DNA modification methylase